MENWKNRSLIDLPNEEWRDIPGYECLFQASTMGRIKCVLKNEISPQYLNSRYCVVRVANNLGNKMKKVHRLVALTFIPNPENKPQVNHKKGIKTDNRVTEIEWATVKENRQHAIEILLYDTIGEKNGRATITNKEAKEIFESTLTPSELSIKYGVSKRKIHYIKNGGTYSKITGKKYERYRLTEQEVIEIFNSPLKYNELSKIYDTYFNNIYKIKAGKIWSNITGKYFKSENPNNYGQPDSREAM